MATTNKHLAYRYGYCVNEKCDKSKKDAKGKYEIQQVASHKPLLCSECQKALHECPPPKTKGSIPVKFIGIIAAAIILLGGIGFGIYQLVGSSKPTAIKLDKAKLTLTVGEKDLIVPTAEPEGVKATFTFKVTTGASSVSVSSGGEIAALKAGEAVVLVKCEENKELRANCKITVKEKEAPEAEPEPVEDKVEEAPAEEESKADETPKEETKKDTGKSTSSSSSSSQTQPQTGSGTVNLGYGTYTGNLKNGKPDGTGKLTFTRSYQLNSEYTAEPGEYVQGIFENGKPSFVTYYKKDGSVTKIKLR